MDVALARQGRAGRVGKILVEMVDQMPAPDQVAAQTAMREGNDIDRLVGQQGQGHDQALVALAARDGPANQALAEKVEDAVVSRAGQPHPGVGAEEGAGQVRFEIGGPQVAPGQDRGKYGINHARGGRWRGVGLRASPLPSLPQKGRTQRADRQLRRSHRYSTRCEFSNLKKSAKFLSSFSIRKELLSQMFDCGEAIFRRLFKPVGQIVRLVVERADRNAALLHKKSMAALARSVNVCFGRDTPAG